MKTSSTSTQRKPDSRKRTASALATCPVDGAGWCPYPFSPAQLAKRLKEKAALSVTEVAVSASGKPAQSKAKRG